MSDMGRTWTTRKKIDTLLSVTHPFQRHGRGSMLSSRYKKFRVSKDTEHGGHLYDRRRFIVQYLIELPLGDQAASGAPVMTSNERDLH